VAGSLEGDLSGNARDSASSSGKASRVRLTSRAEALTPSAQPISGSEPIPGYPSFTCRRSAVGSPHQQVATTNARDRITRNARRSVDEAITFEQYSEARMQDLMLRQARLERQLTAPKKHGNRIGKPKQDGVTTSSLVERSAPHRLLAKKIYWLSAGTIAHQAASGRAAEQGRSSISKSLRRASRPRDRRERTVPTGIERIPAVSS
jgi:hypothetical protein